MTEARREWGRGLWVVVFYLCLVLAWLGLYSKAAVGLAPAEGVGEKAGKGGGGGGGGGKGGGQGEGEEDDEKADELSSVDYNDLPPPVMKRGCCCTVM